MLIGRATPAAHAANDLAVPDAPEQSVFPLSPAALAIAAGRVAIVPLDTRWAAMVALDHAERLLPIVRAADRSTAAGATTLHVGHELTLPTYVKRLLPIAQRALSAFAGEPVTLRIEVDASMAADLPGPAELAIESDHLSVRVAPRTDARVCESFGMALGDGLQSVHTRAEADALVARLAEQGVEAEVFGTTTPANVPSTIVEFPLRGGFIISRVGMLSRERVERLLTLNVLLVCTGNTCRSPMAEAIGRDLAERLPPGSVPVRFRSAGVAAETGAAPTPEAVAAVRAMGIAPPTGRAQPLTPELVQWADVIYTMTASHERAARQLAKGRTVSMLGHKDIPDPIGQGPEVYQRTAQLLRLELSGRLARLGAERHVAKPGFPASPETKDHP